MKKTKRSKQAEAGTTPTTLKTKARFLFETDFIDEDEEDDYENDKKTKGKESAISKSKTKKVSQLAGDSKKGKLNKQVSCHK